MRDLLNTGAQLIATAENLRLQRRVLWLTVISLIVAAIAAAAAVLALQTSTSSLAPAPSTGIHYAKIQQPEDPPRFGPSKPQHVA